MPRRETNPHFLPRPSRPPHEDPRRPPVSPLPPPPQHQDRHGQPPFGGARTRHEDEPHRPRRPPVSGQPPPVQPQEQHGELPLPRTRREDHETSRQPGRQRVKFLEPSSPPKKPHDSPMLTPVARPPDDHPPEPRQPRHEHRHRQPRDEHLGRGPGLRVPTSRKTHPFAWFGAVLCLIFWVVIIVGGLIVLIVYLVFRPQSPHFDVSGVTLNAAYLDLGYLLNADVTMLANFSNPNKKVHVDFSSVIIYLYYGRTLIATHYVEPFSAARVQSRLATIHMVTSQVQLPLIESQSLMKQMEGNGILFQVRGVFRARSKLGSILRYSYNLYGLCSIMVTRPPDGILLKRKCRTKR